MFNKKKIIIIENILNNRAKKVLGYKTSYELFFSKMDKRLAS